MKLSKYSWLGIIIALFLMYQMVPVYFNIRAFGAFLNKDTSLGEKYANLAIKASLIPWQKGCYYINMGSFSALDNDFNKAIIYYDKAYSYINSYKYPCWGFAYLHYYYAGQYDKAIEMSKVWTPENGKIVPQYGTISRCHMMKGEIKKAQFYIDKALETESTPYNMALKAFIEKKTGNLNTAKEFYKKALAKATEPEYNISEDSVKEIYADWYAYEKKVISNFKYR